jgi:hypothetical protein
MFKKFLKFLGAMAMVALTAFITGFASTKGSMYAGARA